MTHAMYPEKIVAVSPAKGKTHRLADPVRSIVDLPTNARLAFATTALCGAYVEAMGGWDERGWAAHMDDYRRLHGTHEHYTCARCAKKFDAMAED